MISRDNSRNGIVGERSLRVLQVSTFDIAGGAEKVAWDLFQAYRKRGVDSWLAVGRKRSFDPNIIVLPNDKSAGIWGQFCGALGARLKPLQGRAPGVGRMCAWLNAWASPFRETGRRLGIEDYNYPGTYRLLELLPDKPDIVHCHNLHGEYFDLRFLSVLSEELPTVLTLHDAWLLSGHCAHSFDCERWKTGCGHCPDITIYPAIERDGTAYNWRRKRSIYARSQLYISTPCKWLMRKVEHSILDRAKVESKIIPYGVDLTIFRPDNKQAVRSALGIRQEAMVLLFSANGIKNNIWKDFHTLRTAVGLVGERLHDKAVLCIALGEGAPTERIGGADIHFIPFQKDPRTVASYYQAADIYVHAARVDTFPNTVLESLACGTPVVATAVGGIPEQVRSVEEVVGTEHHAYGLGEATGVLVPLGDANAMAVAIERLLTNNPLRHRLSENAAKDARNRFDLQRQVNEYLEWYREILQSAVQKRREAASMSQ
jgi:glycosyltransferase involved in cell wall biosynthesis